MIILKKFHIANQHEQIEVLLKEYLDSTDYPLFTWPGSLLLAAFLVAHKHSVHNKVVLELGAGTALPALTCGKLGASKVIITERGDQGEMLRAIEEGIALNGLQHSCEVQPLTWGFIPMSAKSNQDVDMEVVDVVLGADVFYNTEDFDRILLTVFRYFVSNPTCVFYTTYQERSCFRTILPLLQKYQLTAEVIDKATFLQESHADGLCDLEVSHFNEVHQLLRKEIIPKELETFDDIHLIKITVKSNLT